MTTPVLRRRVTALGLDCYDRVTSGDARSFDAIADDVRQQQGLPADSPLMAYAVDGVAVSAEEWARQARATGVMT